MSSICRRFKRIRTNQVNVRHCHTFNELTAWRWLLVCVVTTVGAVANCCDDVDAVEVDAVVDDCVVTRIAYIFR